MAGQLMLIGNPARRKSRKARTPAQKAATRRMIAANRSRKSPRRAKRSTSATLSNPIRRTRRAKRAATSHRRTRRNPISRDTFRGIVPVLKSAGAGALGAIGVDLAYGFASSYLPVSVAGPVNSDGSMNYAYYAAKGAAAIALGMVTKRFIGASKAGHIVGGSLTVTIHDAMKQFLATSSMGANLTLGRLSPGLPTRLPNVGLNQYIPGTSKLSGAPNSVGQYVSGNSRMRARELRYS